MTRVEMVAAEATPGAETGLSGGPPTTPPVTSATTRNAAYDYCWRIAVGHYENFTLGSRFLPRHLRRHIAAIYAFARTADDLADEGPATSTQRLARLDEWQAMLDAAYRGESGHPVCVAVADTAARHSLPFVEFVRLLDAFRRDATFRPFADFGELRAYCRGSADPVGHLVLGLFGVRDEVRRELADRICTGLQLVNFCQDVAVDASRGRLYIPLDEIDRFGCTRYEIEAGLATRPLRRLLAFQAARAGEWLCAGLDLAEQVEPLLGREVRLFAGGGLAILEHIREQGFDVFSCRPTLSGRAKAGLIIRTVTGRPLPGSRRTWGSEGPAGADLAEPTKVGEI